MKYFISSNQKQALELGITNINQALIFDLLTGLSTWATPEIIDGEVFYWASRTKIAEELPLLSLKPDTIYRHLVSLKELGLIDYEKAGKKDCVRLTPKGKSYYVGNESEVSQNSEMNPIKLGNESENNSEMNPTYKNTNNINKPKDNMFDSFWKNYPRKQDRKKAEKAFSRIPEKNKQKAIDDCKIRYADTPAQYIPLPTTYLNGERWNDEIIKTDKQKPEWATLPRANDELWPFAKKHGYSAPGSKTYDQYRQSLTIEIERRLHKEGIFV